MNWRYPKRSIYNKCSFVAIPKKQKEFLSVFRQKSIVSMDMSYFSGYDSNTKTFIVNPMFFSEYHPALRLSRPSAVVDGVEVPCFIPQEDKCSPFIYYRDLVEHWMNCRSNFPESAVITRKDVNDPKFRFKFGHFEYRLLRGGIPMPNMIYHRETSKGDLIEIPLVINVEDEMNRKKRFLTIEYDLNTFWDNVIKKMNEHDGSTKEPFSTKDYSSFIAKDYESCSLCKIVGDCPVHYDKELSSDDEETDEDGYCPICLSVARCEMTCCFKHGCRISSSSSSSDIEEEEENDETEEIPEECVEFFEECVFCYKEFEDSLTKTRVTKEIKKDIDLEEVVRRGKSIRGIRPLCDLSEVTDESDDDDDDEIIVDEVTTTTKTKFSLTISLVNGEYVGRTLPKNEEEINDGDECIVCMDMYSDIALVPCGHTTCPDCIADLKIDADEQEVKISCPVCRKPVDTYLRIFKT